MGKGLARCARRGVWGHCAPARSGQQKRGRADGKVSVTGGPTGARDALAGPRCACVRLCAALCGSGSGSGAAAARSLHSPPRWTSSSACSSSGPCAWPLAWLFASRHGHGMVWWSSASPSRSGRCRASALRWPHRHDPRDHRTTRRRMPPSAHSSACVRAVLLRGHLHQTASLHVPLHNEAAALERQARHVGEEFLLDHHNRNVQAQADGSLS
jgi:hypothetical protein